MLKKKMSIALVGLICLSAFSGCKEPEEEIKTGAVMEVEKSNAYVVSQLGEDVIPVSLYVGPTPSYTNSGVNYPSLITDEVYQNLKELGVNMIMTHNESREEDIHATMQLCDKYGFAYLLQVHGANQQFSRLEGNTIVCYDDYTEEEKAEAKQYLLDGIAPYVEYDSFAGVKFWDEQGMLTFPAVKSAQAILKELHPDKLFYCNLLGGTAGSSEILATAQYHTSGINFATNELITAAKTKGWDFYIDNFLEVAEPEVLSYDVYPWGSLTTDITKGYMNWLGSAASKARTSKVAFWNFVQTSSFGDGICRTPNYYELGYNINTSLMYGAQGIECFNVINPVEWASAYNAGTCLTPLDLYGKPANNYYDLQKVFKQVQAVDHILMKSVFKGVLQSSQTREALARPIMNNLKEFNQVKGIRADFTYALAGCFNYQGHTALYVVNASIKESEVSNVYIDFNQKVKGYAIQSCEETKFEGYTYTIPALKAGEAVMVVID